VLAYTYALTGEPAKAEQALRDLDDLAKQRYISPEWPVMLPVFKNTDVLRMIGHLVKWLGERQADR